MFAQDLSNNDFEVLVYVMYYSLSVFDNEFENVLFDWKRSLEYLW